jgi:DNA-binding FadR family transcriptional regulator
LATSFTISSPVSSDDRFNEVMRQHQAVFDAIEQRKPSAASDAMAALILQAAERVQIKHAGSTLAKIQIHAFSGAD